MAAYPFIGGPADGRSIELVSPASSVRFFEFKIEGPNGEEVAHPDAMRVTRYIHTVLPDRDVYFYRSEGLDYDSACRGFIQRMKPA